MVTDDRTRVVVVEILRIDAEIARLIYGRSKWKNLQTQCRTIPSAVRDSRSILSLLHDDQRQTPLIHEHSRERLRVLDQSSRQYPFTGACSPYRVESNPGLFGSIAIPGPSSKSVFS